MMHINIDQQMILDSMSFPYKLAIKSGMPTSAAIRELRRQCVIAIKECSSIEDSIDLMKSCEELIRAAQAGETRFSTIKGD